MVCSPMLLVAAARRRHGCRETTVSGFRFRAAMMPALVISGPFPPPALAMRRSFLIAFFSSPASLSQFIRTATKPTQSTGPPPAPLAPQSLLRAPIRLRLFNHPLPLFSPFLLLLLLQGRIMTVDVPHQMIQKPRVRPRRVTAALRTAPKRPETRSYIAVLVCLRIPLENGGNIVVI